jgi:hypothetical protein
MFMPLLRPFDLSMKFCLPFALTGLFTVLTAPCLIAQNAYFQRIAQAIPWSDTTPLEGGAAGDYFFSGAHADARTGLPVFYFRQPLERSQNFPAYRFLAEEVTPVPDFYLQVIAQHELTSDWQVQLKNTDGGGAPYLLLELIPLRIRNGQVERLTSFELEAESGPGAGQERGGGPFPFADHSALAEGTWYKIGIARDGVYRIDRSFLSQLGVDLATLNPQQINIYGNGGELLPADNSVFRYDDIQKNAIHVQGEADGSFDASDFILFYGKGPDSWELKSSGSINRKRWMHSKHYYSDSAYYFIRIDDPSPLRIAQSPWPDTPETHTSETFQDFQFIENDLINLAKSGREFYGEEFDINTTQTFTFSFPNATNLPGSVDFQGVSASVGAASSFSITCQGSSGSVTPPSIGTSVTSSVAANGQTTFSFNPGGSSFPVVVNYSKANSQAVGWLDYLTLNATRDLVMTGNQMRFRDSTGIGEGAVARYLLNQASAVSEIWDITNPLNPVRVPFELAGQVAEWKWPHDALREFIAFRTTGFLTPTAIGAIENQDLHALETPDLMIITAPRLLSAAEELAAVHEAEGLTVAITTPEKVFNEFSSGNPDVTAFRMLMLMFYRRANGMEAEMPGNLLLFGDGNYLLNKGLQAQRGGNVLVFESDNSLSPIQSYVSDDYFVMLSDDDTASPLGLLDCGVGRIPTSTLSEANAYVNKVKRYLAGNTAAAASGLCIGEEAESPYGNWRNNITFVADDQDGNGGPTEPIHLTSSEFIADRVRERHPEYDITKLYMDAFTQQTTPGGERYPEGENRIRERVQNGTLLVTYIGHGGERGWGHERILDIPTITNWSNRFRMPVFLTATCEMARFDDPSFLSSGEILVKNPNGGAIAMLTTTRIVFSGENFQMDTAFFRVALDEANLANLTLGKINQLTKNGVPVGNDSKPNFSLLGDPALKMSYPQYNVYTTSINDIDIELHTDTLKSLQEIVISGYVGDVDGNKLTDFNGFVYPTVFDKPSLVSTQNNDGGVVQQFDTHNKIIYRGKASVTGGDFSFRFVVPFDINYNVAKGRVSYYADAGNRDAHGSNESFLIGSILNSAELNDEGPLVEVYMNDSLFVSGGITNPNPILLVRLKDENGINTVGNGIGHDITGVIDGDSQNPIVLNDYYESDLDTYQSGEVRYQLNNLPPGAHRISIKAWDVHNNSGEGNIEFVVAETEEIALEHVLNYPNPFTTSTQFFFEHNQACELLDVRIQIFTIGGKLVKTIQNEVRQSGFRSEPIPWDGLDDFGDQLAKGVYVYKVEVANPEGKRAEKFEKLVILK